tara:strand:+ start:1435 stop:2415 length:981 start_codon:yes stop_codon:yes gene_type:complete
MTGVYVLADHNRGATDPATHEAFTAAATLAANLGESVIAVCVGLFDSDFETTCSQYGISEGIILKSDLITDYGPEIWGQAVADLVNLCDPRVIMAVGTDKGNEVLAQASARTDMPFVANCIEVEHNGDWVITRTQWGGSLLEDVTVSGDLLFLSYAHHAVEPVPSATPTQVALQLLEVEIDPALARTLVQDRTSQTEGATLSTASVVISGGRGVGSADAFGPLEELAELLSGKVGCSRAVTNNGWRSHADQVGQTGTRIAPEIYIACGISGAIQHWVGAMASKNILAINTDPEANMVTKAGYAVIADLHEVVPAVIDEISRRRGTT